MLRFCGKHLVEVSDNLNVVVEKRHFMLDERIWQEQNAYFKNNGYYGNETVRMIPIVDMRGEIICYGWQDVEANRELRMLKELEENSKYLQFKDVYPDIRKVIVCGCNELAYYFVRYLHKLKIPVSVKGRYWEQLAAEIVEDNGLDDCNTMIIYAERIFENEKNLFQRVIRSASPEFECIDRIYEANLLAGNIKDTDGDFSNLLRKLEDKNIVILGTDEVAQDTYDLLYAQGIDIKYFVVENMLTETPRLLLGKRVTDIAEVLRDEEQVVLIDVHDKNSAWGGVKYVELFDYYGYVRNQNFFLINDYTSIPCSNLIHILKGKNVFLVGDESLCKILADYLRDIEHGDIKLQYAKTLREGMVKKTDILCMVYLWYGIDAFEKKKKFFGEYTISMPCTNYFSMTRVFVDIDQYRTRCADKYLVKNLVPKGILLNITNTSNGNVFLKGILDGHPNIILMPYNFLDENLFVYCICLSIEKAEDICRVFQLMLRQNMNEEQILSVFPLWKTFEDSMERWLSLQDKYTSQELFLIFHLAYAEMISGKRIADLSQSIIYFDSHWTPLAERYFLAKWLESENVDTQIISVHRDNVAWFASTYKTCLGINEEEMELARETLEWIYQKKLEYKPKQVNYKYCKEFEVRFEDLKLNPEEELLKICKQLKIPWSDTMLRTTLYGKAHSLWNVKDFDLRPLINKHETFWSEFDRFRLCLIMSAHQKKYGYFYEDCMRFSRGELQEMFLKEFRFQSKLQFKSEREKSSYYLWAQEFIRWQLYENRKYAVLYDIEPRFESIFKAPKTRKEVIDNLISLIRDKEQLVLYGLGRDGEILWDCLDEALQSRLVLCDKRAENGIYLFCGKQVIRPKELCKQYSEYEILVTSSKYYKEIIMELSDMGIHMGRINYNTMRLWE